MMRLRRLSTVEIAVAGVIAVLVLVGLVSRVASRPDPPASTDNDPRTVFVVPAEEAPKTAEIEVPGTVSGLTEAPLLARSDGYVKRRLVDIGDRVKAGQLLAVIDSPDLDQQVDQARAALMQSESQLAQAQASLIQSQANEKLAAITAARWTRLRDRGAVSRQDYDTNNTAYQAQAASVNVAIANVTASEYNVRANKASLQRYLELQSYEQVRAPFDGIITQRNIDVGTLINTGSTLLFRVADAHIVRTFVNVPETDAASVRVGQAATLTVAAFRDRTFTGTVTRVADALDTATRTMLTEIQVTNEDLSLRPGMYATVQLRVPRTVPVVLVPSASLVVRAAGTFVATVTPAQTVLFRPVSVGRDFGETIEILSGLHVGDHVVSNPNDNVIEGAKVDARVLGGDGANASSAGGSASAPSGPAPSTKTRTPTPASR